MRSVGDSLMRCVSVAILVLAASQMFASEAQPAASENAIAAAKREMEAIKAAGVSAEQQELLLPPNSLPSLDPKVDVPVSLSPLGRLRQEADQALEKQQRSKNWLMDAMTTPRSADGKSPAGGVAHRKTANDGEFHASPGDAFNSQSDGMRPAVEHDRRKHDLEKKSSPNANPLASYMGSWMSSGDYRLLLPADDSSDSPVFKLGLDSTRNEDSAFSSDDANRLALGFEAVSESVGASGSVNPYLPGDTSQEPFSQAPNALPTLPGASMLLNPAQISTVTALPPVSETKSQPPLRELLKPSDDAKYFKQLKRF